MTPSVRKALVNQDRTVLSLHQAVQVAEDQPVVPVLRASWCER
jgi:hypothetical protein